MISHHYKMRLCGWTLVVHFMHSYESLGVHFVHPYGSLGVHFVHSFGILRMHSCGGIPFILNFKVDKNCVFAFLSCFVIKCVATAPLWWYLHYNTLKVFPSTLLCKSLFKIVVKDTLPRGRRSTISKLLKFMCFYCIC